MDTLLHDVRTAARALAKDARFTIVAALTLALGVGAATSIFGLADSVLLRPLPGVAAPDRLVSIYTSDFSSGPYGTSSYPDYVDYREQAATFSDLAAFSGFALDVNFSSGGEPERIDAVFASSNYFETLGVTPAIGRATLGADADATGARGVVLSHALWQRQFGGVPDAVGETVRLGERTFTIVGVAPFDFRGTQLGAVPDVFVPIGAADELLGPGILDERGTRWLGMIGRLAPGATLEQAAVEIRSITARLAEADAVAFPASILHHRVLGFALGISLAAGIAFGFVPALRASRAPLVSVLKAGASRTSTARGILDLRRALVVGQIALALILLIGAALFVKSLRETLAIDPGYALERALIASVDLGRESYDETSGLAFFAALKERIESQPQVAAAAYARLVPVDPFGMRRGVSVDGYAPSPGEDMENYSPSMEVVVASTGDPRALAPMIRAEVARLDANLPLFAVRTLRAHLGSLVATDRTASTLVLVFGVVALLLAALGIYGVMAFAVAQRTREIGIRMALGANTASVLRLVVGRGAVLTALGVLVGLGIGLPATRTLSSALYGVDAAEPAVWLGTTLALACTAVVACYVPAKRAAGVQPTTALREE